MDSQKSILFPIKVHTISILCTVFSIFFPVRCYSLFSFSANLRVFLYGYLIFNFLFQELITKGEPWTKEMELSVTDNELVLLDTETQELIERYPLSHIDSVQDVNDDPMLKSVLVFSTIQTPEKYAAVHLFQCDKVPVRDGPLEN